MNFIGQMNSEWLKTKRTAFRYIVLITPIVFPLLILTYASHYKVDSLWQIRVYGIYFTFLGIALPMKTAILTGLNIMQEEGASNFIGLLTEPLAKERLYLGKLTILLIITIIDMLISTGILLLAMKWIYKVENINYGIFIQGTLLIIVSVLFLYGLYLIISFAFGIGPTVSIAIGGGVWGMLLQTGLGDEIWQFVPWAWAGRLSILPCLKFENYSKLNGTENIDGIDIIIRNMFTTEISKGLPIAIVTFILITIMGMVWFSKWEGKKTHQ